MRAASPRRHEQWHSDWRLAFVPRRIHRQARHAARLYLPQAGKPLCGRPAREGCIRPKRNSRLGIGTGESARRVTTSVGRCSANPVLLQPAWPRRLSPKVIQQTQRPHLRRECSWQLTAGKFVSRDSRPGITSHEGNPGKKHPGDRTRAARLFAAIASVNQSAFQWL